MIIKTFKSRYCLLLNVPLNISNLQCKEYSNLHKLQNITNTNNDDYINNGTKYAEQSHEQYDLLLLFIRDNPKMNDIESSFTINSTITGCDTKSKTIITVARFMYKVSVIRRSWYSVKQNVPKQRHARCRLLFQDCFDIVVCLMEYLRCLQKKILARAINLITDFAFFGQICAHITYRTFMTKL